MLPRNVSANLLRFLIITLRSLRIMFFRAKPFIRCIFSAYDNTFFGDMQVSLFHKDRQTSIGLLKRLTDRRASLYYKDWHRSIIKTDRQTGIVLLTRMTTADRVREIYDKQAYNKRLLMKGHPQTPRNITLEYGTIGRI